MRRTWTLASSLVAQGASVEFVLATPDGESTLREAGFAIDSEAMPDQIDLTLAAARRGGERGLVVVDDAGVTSDALAALAAVSPVACIDDTAERDVPVDVVVNGTVGAEALSYRGLQRTRYLLGPRYLLLRPEFAGGPERITPDEVTRVLVLVGGGDLGSLLERLTDAILETLPEVAVDVVIGPFGGRPSMDSRIHVHTTPKDILGLMLGADMAVSGGGQTAYELAATGTPTVGIRLADNQAMNLQGLAAAGCLRAVGEPDDDGFWRRLTGTLRMLAADATERKRMTARGRRLVDGGGAARVATFLCAAGG